MQIGKKSGSLTILRAGERMEQQKLLCCWKIFKLLQPPWKAVGRQGDPAILGPGTGLRETFKQQGPHTRLIRKTLFLATKTKSSQISIAGERVTRHPTTSHCTAGKRTCIKTWTHFSARRWGEMSKTQNIPYDLFLETQKQAKLKHMH